METVVLSHVKTGQAGQARVSSVLEASGTTFSSRWLKEDTKVPGRQQMRALKGGCLGGRLMRDGNVVALEGDTSMCVFLSFLHLHPFLPPLTHLPPTPGTQCPLSFARFRV